MCLDPDKQYSALLTTNKGDLTLELDQSIAPLTVNNFVFLARHLYFDDTPCHRIIPNFVVQCGDPTGTGTGGPGYELRGRASRTPASTRSVRSRWRTAVRTPTAASSSSSPAKTARPSHRATRSSAQ